MGATITCASFRLKEVECAFGMRFFIWNSKWVGGLSISFGFPERGCQVASILILFVSNDKFKSPKAEQKCDWCLWILRLERTRDLSRALDELWYGDERSNSYRTRPSASKAVTIQEPIIPLSSKVCRKAWGICSRLGNHARRTHLHNVSHNHIGNFLETIIF